MIGTRIRGFRHLGRLAETLKEPQIFFKHDSFSIGNGTVVYVDYSKNGNPFMNVSGNYLLLFNDCFSNVKFNSDKIKDDELREKASRLIGKYGNVWLIPLLIKNRKREESSYFYDIVLVPENFDKMYSDFCDANKKQMPNATRFLEMNSDTYRYIFAITSGSKNFFFWAINAMFKSHISIYQIEKAMLWNDNYNNLQSKLKKGTMTAYTNECDFFSMTREMAMLRRDKRANDVISSFNTAQKKALKGYSLSARDYETLSKFGKLSGKKKNNFIRKMSTIEDPAEILRQMSFLADIHFEWNKKSFLDYVNNLENFNCEIVLDKDNIVLLKVHDYEAVKRLAKATNWCISKDKKYWNEYVECHHDATQYVIFDFSRKEDDNLSIVGFTSVHDRGITHAHDFQNRNILGQKRHNTVSLLKSFVSKYVDASNIYGVLDKNGINISDVVTYEPNHYKWNRESMFSYLNQCVDEDDYYIIYDGGGKVVIIAENDNIRYFLGDNYIEQRHYVYNYGDQHIIFADFNKKQNDPEKLVFGVIHHNFSTHESRCNGLFNDRFEPITQSFDSKLEEYGLPYDVICRTENVVDRFFTAFTGLDLPTVKELIKNEEVQEEIKAGDRKGLLRDALINATFSFNSLDYINLIYDSGMTIGEVIGDRNLVDFARRVMNQFFDIEINPHVPSADELDAFKKETLGNYYTAVYDGYFTILMMILDHEKSNNLAYSLASSILERHRVCDLCDLILTRICDIVDINNSDVTKYILSYAYNYGSNRVINAVNSKNPGPNVLDLIRQYKHRDVKTTEMWVRNIDGTYAIQEVNEEAIAHAPRRR